MTVELESGRLRQLRNSHDRSASRPRAENYAVMGISELSARIRLAGFWIEEDGGRVFFVFAWRRFPLLGPDTRNREPGTRGARSAQSADRALFTIWER